MKKHQITLGGLEDVKLSYNSTRHSPTHFHLQTTNITQTQFAINWVIFKQETAAKKK